MNINVEIARNNKKWSEYRRITRKMIADITKVVLTKYKNLSKIREVELSVLLTNNSEMMDLNKQFRNKNYPTNVLSFPDADIDWRNVSAFESNENYMYLGDIAFGLEIIEIEAKDKDWEFVDYFTHLLVHAILHLIGYDHKEETGAKAMESLETEILQKLGIKSPYLDF